jgi:hypothetical protein
MARRDAWKMVSGILAAGSMLLGCFVPVVYGVYKVIDKKDQQVITVNMQEHPQAIYETAIATMEERGGKIDKRDDKELFLAGKSRSGQDATLKVSGLAEGGSVLTITVAKGKDPEAEREEIVNTVLSVCRKKGIACSEANHKR